MDRVDIIAAVAAVAPGAGVVPCSPHEKRSCWVGWADRGVSDVSQIAQVFADPQFNVGLVLGEQIVVIDVEGPLKESEESRKGTINLANLEAKLGKLPPTIVAATPSGGQHIYFKAPAGVLFKPQAKLLGQDGIELRTGRQLVVVPPSRVPNTDGEVVEYRYVPGRAPWEIDIAELPKAWVEAALNFQSKLAVSTYVPNIGSESNNRAAKWPSIIRGCAFACWAAGEGASKLAEPSWYALMNLMSYCQGGREAARAASAPYPGYSAAETDRKFDHASVCLPYTCEYIATTFGFEGCQRCPLRAMDAKSPIALGYVTELIAEAQSRLVYDIGTRRYFNTKTGAVHGYQAISDSLKSRLGKNPHEQLMQSKCTAKVDGMDYRPGDERLILETPIGKQINTWRKGGVEAKDGDASLLHDFFEYLFPDPAAQAHVLDWLAFLYGRTGHKVKHGLIITGPPGTGKSTLNQIVKLLFGESNASTVPGERLGSKFKAALVNKEILIAEEARHGERLEVAEDLKELVTADTIMVEEKHVSAYEARTPRGVIITSNWVSPIVLMGNDRRWFVAETTKQKASVTYFEKLYAALEDGVTVSAFAAGLLGRDLSMFKPDAHPPMTDAKIEAIEASRTPLAAMLAQAIDERMEPFHRDIVTVEQIEVSTTRYRWQFDGVKVNRQRIANALNELGCESLGRVRLNGKPMRPWAVRDISRWRNEQPAALQAEYSPIVRLPPAHMPQATLQ